MSKAAPESPWPDDERLGAYGLQDLAAMNARVYAMTGEDRERWFREHPVEMYEEKVT